MGRGPRHGWGHRRVRRWYVARYRPGRSRCVLGGEILTQLPSQLDLAHNDAKPGEYLGLACQHHNRSRHAESPFARPRGKQRTRTRQTNDDRPADLAAEREHERRTRIDQRERQRRRLFIVRDEDTR
jgi:hypothetical protein